MPTLDDILGQPRAVQALRAALAAGRMHHAWILSGPRGVGKCTTALAIAAELVGRADSPDVHVIRKELAAISTVDELRRRKQLNIPIDLLREFVIGGRTSNGKTHDGPAYLTASAGGAKVFVIDEAELLDAIGQNALLKTLEEPPPRTYFFLVTTRPERLLPTIHSRCQHVRFGALDDAAMNAWLDRNDLEVDAEARDWIVHFAAGSPGIALVAARYGFHGWRTEIGPALQALDRGRYPDTLAETLGNLVDAFATQWVKDHRHASKDAANRAGLDHVLSVLAAHVRTGLADACAQHADPERWLRVIDVIDECRDQVRSNVNMKQALELMVGLWTEECTAA